MKITKLASRRLASQFALGPRGIIYADDSAGNVWTTDSYSAIRTKIEPNTPRATVADTRPKMDSILEALTDLEPVTSEVENDGDFPSIYLNDKVPVNADYLNRLKQALPKAQILVGGKYMPVVFKQNGQVVALLMPLTT